jgi:hypothetical protein
MRALLVVLSLLVSAPVLAADVTVTLNDEEQNVLRQLLDMATKAGGLQVAPAALHFARKLEAAQAAPKPAPKADAVAPNSTSPQ